MKEEKTSGNISEFKTCGVLSKKGIDVTEECNIEALSSRGYGSKEDDQFTLSPCEALYLLDKNMLEAKDKTGKIVDFQQLLKTFEKTNKSMWIEFLVYRDLRSRGYVVREGFGKGIAFRVYERGAYGKDTASYLALSVQEGQPLPMEDLREAQKLCQSQKKELILAVMNRRGEIVYYSISQLTFK